LGTGQFRCAGAGTRAQGALQVHGGQAGGQAGNAPQLPPSRSQRRRWRHRLHGGASSRGQRIGSSSSSSDQWVGFETTQHSYSVLTCCRLARAPQCRVPRAAAASPSPLTASRPGPMSACCWTASAAARGVGDAFTQCRAAGASGTMCAAEPPLQPPPPPPLQPPLPPPQPQHRQAESAPPLGPRGYPPSTGLAGKFSRASSTIRCGPASWPTIGLDDIVRGLWDWLWEAKCGSRGGKKVKQWRVWGDQSIPMPHSFLPPGAARRPPAASPPDQSSQQTWPLGSLQ
jgi:hypothetical protein